MSDQYIGEVRCVGFNFAQTSWAFCDGQLMAISTNTALFSLLGIYYGGDGKTTFGLPNLQGRAAIAQGSGPGLSPRSIGETGGSPSITLIQAEMARHNHNYMTNVGDGPADQVNATATSSISSGPAMFSTSPTPTVAMASNMLPIVGNNQAHNNMMPYLSLNFVIALNGIYPQRG